MSLVVLRYVAHDLVQLPAFFAEFAQSESTIDQIFEILTLGEFLNWSRSFPQSVQNWPNATIFRSHSSVVFWHTSLESNPR